MRLVRTNMWVLACVLMLAGCAQEADRKSVLTGSSITLNTITPDAAFKAAESVICKTYRINSCDPIRHQIITVPLEYTARDSSGAVGDVLIPSNRTFRNIVSLRVSPAGNCGSMISVRVDVQRRDTVAAQSFAYLRQNDDRPASTSALQQTGASENREKRDVWTDVRRDYKEEQYLLDAIKTCLVPKTAK